MQCEEVRDHFADYLTDSLVEPARSDLHQHLISCASCRDEADALKTVWSRLDQIPAEAPDAAAMRARFDVMLEAYRQGLDHASGADVRQRLNHWIGRFWPRQPVWQFALAVLFLVFGIFIGRAAMEPAEVAGPEIAAMRTELRDMRQLVALSLLQQRSAVDRLQGVSWSNRLDQPGNEVMAALLNTLMSDPNVNVRLAAIDALRKFGEREEVRSGIVEALNKESPPMVQIALIDLAVELEPDNSLEPLRRISQDANQNAAVRERAEMALEALR